MTSQNLMPLLCCSDGFWPKLPLIIFKLGSSLIKLAISGVYSTYCIKVLSLSLNLSDLEVSKGIGDWLIVSNV
jgi:hypothetical protein